MQFLGYLNRQEQRMRKAVDCIEPGRMQERSKPGTDLGEAVSALHRGRRKRRSV